jgi:hypothetical protein
VRETGGLFGLTKNISTNNPVRVATHEYAAIGRDVRAARSWRERAGRVLRGPGWQPGPATAEGPGDVEPPGPSGVRVPQQATGRDCRAHFSRSAYLTASRASVRPAP